MSFPSAQQTVSKLRKLHKHDLPSWCQWIVVHRPLVSVQLCLDPLPASSLSCTWIPLSWILSPYPFSRFPGSPFSCVAFQCLDCSPQSTVLIQLCLEPLPPSSLSCTRIPLSSILSPYPLSRYSWTTLFLCGLAVSIAVLGWQMLSWIRIISTSQFHFRLAGPALAPGQYFSVAVYQLITCCLWWEGFVKQGCCMIMDNSLLLLLIIIISTYLFISWNVDA